MQLLFHTLWISQIRRKKAQRAENRLVLGRVRRGRTADSGCCMCVLKVNIADSITLAGYFYALKVLVQGGDFGSASVENQLGSLIV